MPSDPVEINNVTTVYFGLSDNNGTPSVSWATAATGGPSGGFTTIDDNGLEDVFDSNNNSATLTARVQNRTADLDAVVSITNGTLSSQSVVMRVPANSSVNFTLAIPPKGNANDVTYDFAVSAAWANGNRHDPDFYVKRRGS